MVAKERAVVWSETALADLTAEVKFIAKQDPRAAQDVRRKFDATGTALGISLTGRSGRVPGTYEKTVSGLRFVLAYAVMPVPGGDADADIVVILRAIHTSRDWPPDTCRTDPPIRWQPTKARGVHPSEMFGADAARRVGGPASILKRSRCSQLDRISWALALDCSSKRTVGDQTSGAGW